jgi:hypothetical protein
VSERCDQVGRGGHALGSVAVTFQQEAQGVEDIRLVIGDEDSRPCGFDFRWVLKRDCFHQSTLYFHASSGVISVSLLDVRSQTSSGV